MKRKNNLPGLRLLAAVAFLSLCAVLSPEALNSPEWGYSLDLPEGFVLQDRLGSTRYSFSHQLYPVDLLIAVYPLQQFTRPQDALTFVTGQLESEGPAVTLDWRLRKAAIGQLAFPSKAGWIVSLELADKKGWFVMACFTDSARATELEGLIISTLDSVFTDKGSYFESGPMTSFAWAPEKPFTAFYQDAKRKMEVSFNSIDAEAAQSVVDREFKLLTSYLDSPLVYDAWKRYYRLIYRDSWARLSKPAFLLQNALPSDPAALAAELLAWTQSFTYERNFDGSDFLNLPEAFVTKKADCDSRSLLMVLLLNQMGVDAVLLVSPEYSHSVAAVDCPGEGARFTVGKKKYLIADTTAKVGMGKIAQDMADSSKWFAVTFYAFPQ